VKILDFSLGFCLGWNARNGWSGEPAGSSYASLVLS